MEALIYFKRSRSQNYMMRSEKRPGYPNASRRQKPPKRDFWYRLLTVLLLIFVCPVGLVLLWRKRLAWPNPVKLVATVLSIALLFLMIGGALWYPFQDVRLRNAQQTASNAISHVRETIKDVPENWKAFVENGMKIGAVAGDQALGRILDAIASPTPEPTQMPPMALNSGNGKRDAVVEILNRPTPTPTPSPSLEPTETPDVSANALERPTPSQEPAQTAASEVGGTDTPTALPTNAPTPTAISTATAVPTPTAAPTVDPATIPELKPVSETMVWYTSNGKWYHKGSVCGSMTNPSQHTLASAVKKKLTDCPYCHPIEVSWAKEDDPTVYVSTDSFWHVNPECESCTEDWTPMLLEEARNDRSVTPCDACGALYYADGAPTAVAANASKEATATAKVNAAAPTPLDGATPAPTPIEDGLNLADVTNGDDVVYFSDNTSYYHRRSVCSSSATSVFQPGKLIDALLKNKIACPVCEPPEPAT